MTRNFAFAVAALSLAGPLVAAPPVKRPLCQFGKAPVRDAKRVEQCRRQSIPPILDQTPIFLASTALSAALSDLS